MQIEWVNHASFILQSQNIRLLCDPWLEGRVFHEGWELLSPTAFTYENFDSITHLWFSHEHPDHFNPPNLKKIEIAYRQKIVVLYQKTKDKKVIEFCRDLGFKQVVEIAPGERIQLAEQFDLWCEPLGGRDSWLYCQIEGVTLLNLNDCVVDSREKAIKLRDRLGNIDILMTQFSYASWVGNDDEPRLRARQAKDKLMRLELQAKVLAPKYIFPFASFVTFCHTENRYMMSTVNRISQVVDAIAQKLPCNPVVLYPGDVLSVNGLEDLSHVDYQTALRKYQSDYTHALQLPPVTAASISWAQLQDNCRLFIDMLTRDNDRILLQALLRPTRLFISDLNMSLMLSLDGLDQIKSLEHDCDISLSSDALNYCFRFLWGGDTLDINGRFRIPGGSINYYRYLRFRQYGAVASVNNRGEQLVAIADLKKMQHVRMRKLLKHYIKLAFPPMFG